MTCTQRLNIHLLLSTIFGNPRPRSSPFRTRYVQYICSARGEKCTNDVIGLDVFQIWYLNVCTFSAKHVSIQQRVSDSGCVIS